MTEDEGSSPIKEDQEENLHQLGIIHQHSRSWANFLLEEPLRVIFSGAFTKTGQRSSWLALFARDLCE